MLYNNTAYFSGKKVQFLFCILCFLPFISYSQNFTSNTLSGFKELFQLSATWDAYQDEEGFIWIASSQGLVRYDGINTISYTNNPNDPTSIAGDVVSKIAPDKDGNLWLIIFGEGIDMYDKRLNKFFHYREEMEKAGINLNGIDLYWGQNDRLWIGTQGKEIAYYDRNKNQFGKLKGLQEKFDNSDLPLLVTDFDEDRNGNLWMAQYSRLTMYNPVSDSLTFIKPPYSSPYLVHIEIDSLGTIWIGDKLNGIYAYHPVSGQWNRFAPFYERFTSEKREAINYFELDEDDLWFMAGNDLHRFSSIYENTSYEKADVETLYSVLLRDQEENLFIFGPQVYKKDAHHKPFYHFTTSEQDAEWVNGYVKYGQGQMVYALMGNPLKSFDIEYMKSEIPEKSLLEIEGLTPKILFEDSQGMWWLGDFSSGKRENPHQLYKYNPNSQKLQRIGDKRFRTIGSIIEDENGMIWVGSWGGLYKVHPDTGIVKHYQHEFGNNNSLSNNAIRKLMFDSKGFIWVATHNGGLNRLNPKTNDLKVWKHKREDLESLSSNTAWDIFEDVKGKIWVGTSNGLNLLMPDYSGFKRYLFVKDQNYVEVETIEEDDNGNLWLGSYEVIIRFDPREEKFQIFTSQVGYIVTRMKMGICILEIHIFTPTVSILSQNLHKFT